MFYYFKNRGIIVQNNNKILAISMCSLPNTNHQIAIIIGLDYLPRDCKIGGINHPGVSMANASQYMT